MGTPSCATRAKLKLVEKSGVSLVFGLCVPRTRADFTRRITGHDGPRWNIPADYRTGANNDSVPECAAR
jgi:hypothetical protein